MDPKAVDILLKEIRTLDEVYRLDNELSIVLEESFHMPVNQTSMVPKAKNHPLPKLSEKVKEKVSHITYQAIKELEAKKLINEDNPDALRLFFQQAHSYIMQLPKLQLRVAFTMNEQILTNIYNWVRREIDKPVVIDVIEEPSVLGGCVIVYRGAYRDYSLRTKLHAQAREIFKPILKELGT